MCTPKFVLVSIICYLHSINCELINENVSRKIDLQTQLAKINSSVTIKNIGSRNIDYFIYLIEPNITKLYIQFYNVNDKKLFYMQDNFKDSKNEEAFSSYKVYLDNYLKPNETCNIKIEVIYIDQIVPRIKRRKMHQKQILGHRGNFFFYSPYVTRSLTTTILLKNGLLYAESREDGAIFEPDENKKNSFKFHHKNVAPYSFEELDLGFENNNPIIVVRELQRTIDISHYGKILVEDSLMLQNAGPRFVGPYEPILQDRTDFLYTHLPASAERVKYFDSIGCIYRKTMVMDLNTHKTHIFQLRFPLLGGWKIPYVLQYTVPTHEYLRSNGKENFRLSMRAIDQVINDCVIEEATVKIRLPEGALISKVDIPLGFNRTKNEITSTSFSFIGKTTVVLKGSALIENHIADFSIYYSYSSLYLWKLPLCIAGFLEFFFILIVLRNHVQFRLK